MLGQKSGMALTGPAGPPAMALKTQFQERADTMLSNHSKTFNPDNRNHVIGIFNDYFHIMLYENDWLASRIRHCLLKSRS